jgi:hypothetical protein
LDTATTANALHFAVHISGDDHIEGLLILQNAAFLPMLRASIESCGDVREGRIDQLEPLAVWLCERARRCHLDQL